MRILWGLGGALVGSAATLALGGSPVGGESTEAPVRVVVPDAVSPREPALLPASVTAATFDEPPLAKPAGGGGF